jgi:hypothetical protein
MWSDARLLAAAATALLSLLVAPEPLSAQVTPLPLAAPPLQVQQASTEQTATRIVAVEWRIKKGQENEFLEYWSTRSTIPDRSGLVAEFLNRVESREQFPWMVWEFNENWTTITVAECATLVNSAQSSQKHVVFPASGQSSLHVA